MVIHVDFASQDLPAVGAKSRVFQRELRRLHSCPPPGPELPFSFWGEGETLVREGGFVQCWRTRNSYLWLVRTLLFSVASEGVVRDGEMMKMEMMQTISVCVSSIAFFGFCFDLRLVVLDGFAILCFSHLCVCASG